MDFIFNNHDFSNDLRVNNVRRSIVPPVVDDLLYIPGRDGAYNTGSNFDVLYISFRIILNKLTDRTKVRNLADNLHTQGLKQLILKDEPDKYYNAKLSSRTDLDEIMKVGQGMIIFLCPDPYAYSITEDTEDFANDEATIDNEGTADAFPVFELTIDAVSTYLSVLAPTHQIILGSPESISDTPLPLEELILHDACTTTAGWAAATQVDGGVVDGTMISDGNKFIASDHGAGDSWHGPALKKSFPGAELLQDFQIDILCEQENVPNKIGRVEVYLLDVVNNHIGKIAIKDTSVNANRNQPEGRAGSLAEGQYFLTYNSLYNLNSDYEPASLGYVLFLRLKRVGTRWEAWCAWKDPSYPSYWNIQKAFYADINEAYMTKLAQIQVHLGQSGVRDVAAHSINDIKVYKINDPDAGGIASILNAGDIIEINHYDGSVKRNGEDFMEAYDPFSDFFTLPKGESTLKIVPEGIVSAAKVSWRKRWK